jgi:hypothetical protein
MDQSRVNTLRNIFLILFVISLAFLAVTTAGLSRSGNNFAPAPTEDPAQPDTPETQPGSQSEAQSSFISLSTLIGSAITTVTSLAGFLVTTVITWRKEKRDAALADLDRMKKELELEKSRLELEQLKNKPKKKK